MGNDTDPRTADPPSHDDLDGRGTDPNLDPMGGGAVDPAPHPAVIAADEREAARLEAQSARGEAVAGDAIDRGDEAALAEGGEAPPGGAVAAGAPERTIVDGAPDGHAVDESGVPAAVWDPATAQGFRDRWRDLQLRFVDDPQAAAAQAGTLVGEVVDGLAAALAGRRERLDAWRTDGADTEQMRVAVTRYRDFADRVLDL